jgi:putative cardiolipin synthase
MSSRVIPTRYSEASLSRGYRPWIGALHAVAVALAISVAGGCASLPSLDNRTQTFARTDTDDTRLGRAVASIAAAHPGMTGVHALPSGSDAFAARVALAMAAEKTIDVQYYIWHGDQTGFLLLEQVWLAAGRGARVRMLLDDANTAGFDDTIAALDAHPNIEVRLYNPLLYRGARLANFVVDFTRVNRRMHNKSFTVDNQAAVVGGRNIGNEYFGAGNEDVFRDLDVIAVGAAVRDVSNEFDLYWNSTSAYPAAPFVGTDGSEGIRRLEARFAATRVDPEATDYIRVVVATPLLQQLLGGNLSLEWTHTRLVRDDPAKTLDTEDRTDILLLTDVMQVMGRPQASFDLVSPYFVPGAQGTAALASLAQSGVRVRVLTNSLSSTDVASVHAGYAKRRCDLLRAGVRLYELKPSAATEAERKAKAQLGSSATTRLHAKTFASDGSRIFVGSFNFDPRSARLNTEMGLVIDSADLAQRLENAFDNEIPNLAYEARRTTGGSECVRWIERTPSGEVVYDVEPGTSASERALIEFLSVLPIDWLL